MQSGERDRHVAITLACQCALMVACTGGFLEKEGGSAHSPGMRKMSEKIAQIMSPQN